MKYMNKLPHLDMLPYVWYFRATIYIEKKKRL